MNRKLAVNRLVLAWTVGCALSLVVGNAWADLPAKPAVEGFAQEQRFQPPAGGGIGRIELGIGQVNLYVPAHRAVYPGQFGLALSSQDLIQTAKDPDSRCHVVLDNGDVINLGPGTLLGLEQRGADRAINLWQGEITGYAMPRIEGRDQVLFIQTPEGVLQLKAGKAGIAIDGATTNIAVFNTAGEWSGKDGSRQIFAGQMGQAQAGKFKLAPISGDLEANLTAAVSPEQPAVTRGLAAFRNKDLVTAKQTFTEVQTSFPYNGVAAYNLGSMSLDHGELAAAIAQWQRYVKIDPEGAKEKDVPRQLTSLINQRIKDDVRYALDNEKKLGSAPPEPNSIAVHPLNNKGDPKFNVVGKGLTAMVISDISKVPGLKVLERQKIQKLLDEIKLSQGGLVNEKTAVRSGRLLRAEKQMVGDFKIEAQEGKSTAQEGKPNE